jgi:hypothetical protein
MIADTLHTSKTTAAIATYHKSSMRGQFPAQEQKEFSQLRLKLFDIPHAK